MGRADWKVGPRPIIRDRVHSAEPGIDAKLNCTKELDQNDFGKGRASGNERDFYDPIP